MTLRYLYNGVEQTNTTTRIKGPISSVGERADGSTASGQAIIKDPLGILDYRMLRTFRIVEDACVAAPIQHEGMIYDLRVSRGDYVVGPGRQWSFEFTDLNGLLHERRFHTASAKRKKETGDARMAWLMAQPEMAQIHDHGAIGALVEQYDEEDFRGRDPGDVIQSLMASSVTDDAKTFFVYMDQPSAQASLFVGSPTGSVHTSSLRISNVPGDVDGVTTFPIVPSSELAIDGSEIYDGVYFTTKDGSIYRQSDTTFANYPRHRDGSFDTSRISLGSTAERHATMWLKYHSGRRDTITCTVRLPRNKVGLIQAGDRIQVRFAEFPGYTDWTWTRVTARSFPVIEGLISHYDVQLELNTTGLYPRGGGGAGNFVKQPPAATELTMTVPSGASASTQQFTVALGQYVYFKVFTTDILFAGSSLWIASFESNFAATAGNVSVGGTTFFALVNENPGGAGTHSIGTWTSPEATAPAAMHVNSDPGSQLHPGVFRPGTTPVGYYQCVASPGRGAQGSATGIAPGTYKVRTGGGATDGYIYFGNAGYQITLVIAVSNTPPSSFVFGGGGADDPPLAGQWVPNEVPTPAPDGTTKTFTLANAYVPHSLKVRVDGVPILNGLTETNPDLGTFTLDFAPLGAVGGARAEVILADYQAV